MGKKKKTPPREVSPKTSQYVLATPFYAIIAMIVIGGLLPGRETWGINFLSLVDPAVAVTVVFLAAIALAPPVATAVSSTLRAVFGRLTRSLSRVSKPVLVFLVSIAVTAVLFYWRSKTFVYGDGYIVLGDTSSGENLRLFGQHYLQVLSIYLNHYAYELSASTFGWSADKVLGMSNAIGGMIGLWAVFRICRQLSNDGVTRAFLFLCALSSASVVLFFGYIENYTWALSMALWTLSLSLGYINKENGVVVLLLTAVVAAFFHMITLPFAAIAVASLLLKRRKDGNHILGVPLKYVNVGLVASSFLLVGLSYVLDVDIFVPILPREGNPYSLLAAEHVLDLLNQAALVAPLGTALVLLSWFYIRDKRIPLSAGGALLGTSALLTLTAAIWIDPELGAPRDWDLFAFYGLPLTIWGAHRFTAYFVDHRIPRQWLVAATVIAGLTIIPNLYEKNHPDMAVARLDRLLYIDPHYQATYDDASRCGPWAVTLQQGYGDWRAAIKYLERRISASPDSAITYFNLADSYYKLEILDSAYMFTCLGLKLRPDDPLKLLNASLQANRLGSYRDAAMWAHRAVGLDPGNPATHTQLGLALIYGGRSSEALPYLRKAYDLDPQAYDHIANMAMAHMATGSADSAYGYYINAIGGAPENQRADIYHCLVAVCIRLHRLDEAEFYLEAMRRIKPTSRELQQLSTELAEAKRRR